MNTFILRWNPAISSYKMEEHLDIVSHAKKGQFPTHFDWSVREWQNLKPGDIFILLQVGTDVDGIAMVGKFCSEAYEDSSWRKDGTKVHYADMQIFDAFDLETDSTLRVTSFGKKFPSIKWHGGYSGQLLDAETAVSLVAEIKTTMKDSKRWQEDSFENFLKHDIEILVSNSTDNFETWKEWLDKKQKEILKILSEYKPIVHTEKEEDYDWLSEGEASIEVVNPSTTDPLYVDFESGELSLYFASWHTHYSTSDEDFSEMKTQLLKILHNKSCALSAKKNGEWLGDKISNKHWEKETNFETLIKEFNFLGKDKKTVTEISVTYWANERSFSVKKLK